MKRIAPHDSGDDCNSSRPMENQSVSMVLQFFFLHLMTCYLDWRLENIPFQMQ